MIKQIVLEKKLAYDKIDSIGKRSRFMIKQKALKKEDGL